MTPLPLLALAAASTLCEAARNVSAAFRRPHRADEMHCLCDKGILALRCSISRAGGFCRIPESMQIHLSQSVLALNAQQAWLTRHLHS